MDNILTCIKDDKSNRILITGAVGFIGSHLTQRLIEEGLKVGIIKRKNSNTQRIKNLLDKIEVYDADIVNTNEVFKAVSHFRPDVIFHLATYYVLKHKLEEVPLMVNTNTLGIINLLEVSKELGVKLFVNTSSCVVYKESKNKLKEDSCLKPLNLYALTKLQAEQSCSFYAEEYGLKIVTLRIFPPYGPADHERRLVPYAIKKFLDREKPKMTTGRQKWDFIYVEDIVDAYLKLLSISKIPQKHEIFNIGTGNPISVKKVVLEIDNIINTKIKPEWGAIPHRKNEPWFICADINKARKVLNWEPKIKIGQGLKLTINYYKDFWRKNEKLN